MVNNWLDIIQQLLFPPTCILCGNPGQAGRDLCSHCRLQLPANACCCPCCANRMDAVAAEANRPCGRCIGRPPAFDKVHAPFLYQEDMRYLITGLKFSARHANARLLAQLLAEHIGQNAQRPDCLMPVPLHKARYRERGFNQAIEIGRLVAAETGIPLDLTSCRRRRDTPHQAGLTSKQRRRNIKNAFELVRPVSCRHVAILDDVMTTGSTAHEMAVLLKNQGVERVDVWVCARA
ncbi:ComF family protein [Methylomicrobium lacus]|uniref:ComF family protein n=1 Tax=Methylomicrobium lacus TaxID=136992 RepID=UPI0004A28489|nr:ComF family protein [Methylomicrobium lacus]